jgi:glycosyltransferase involved in cell wall biosynthesis
MGCRVKRWREHPGVCCMSGISIKVDSQVDKAQRIMCSPRCRVAHLHSTLGVYGAERWTLALIKHLDRQEFEPIVISIGTKPGADSFFRLLLSEGLPAEHISVPGKLNPRAVLQLRRLLLRHKIDILHTHHFKADVLGYLATRKLPVRLISTIHGWCASEGLRIRLYEAIGRVFLKRFDRVYPLSPALLEDLRARKFCSSRLRLILNGVDLSGFDYQFNKRRPGEALSVLFAGRVCRSKGIFDLIRGFAQTRCSAPVRLTIVGAGPDRREAEELARTISVADRVQFVGAVPSIAPYLLESHVMVLPSYSEGIPRVVMEAFATGVPVIGTAIAGISQLVEHEITGLLVPVGEPVSLANALERICEDPEFAQRMASMARQVVSEKFSARRMADDFQEEYRRLCYMA